MTDLELINWAINKAGNAAELSRQYKSISQATISNWKQKSAMPDGWRMYFTAQYEKNSDNLKG